MKKIKFNLLAIVGIMTMALTIAFTVPKENAISEPELETWFYKLNSMEPEDLNEPTNYTKGSPSEIQCEGDEVICSIKDEESTSQPGTPAFSHGAVSPGSLDYEIVLRDVS